MSVEVGQCAPDFILQNQHGEPVMLSRYRGESNVLLVFYPFAFSSVCSRELSEIRDNIDELGDDVQVLAVSVDSMFSLRGVRGP